MRTAFGAFRSICRAPVARCKSIAVSALLILALGGVGHSENAQGVWKDASTGKVVEDYPYRAEPDPGHPSRAFRTLTGDNFYRDDEGVWRNGKSGVIVRSYPLGSEVDPNNPDRAYRPGTSEKYYRDLEAQASVPPPRPNSTMLFVTPKIAIGGIGLTGNTSYRSDGGQDSFDNRFTLARPQGCGGASVGTAGTYAFLVDLSACTYFQHHTFFSVPRNAGGLVSLQTSSPVVFDLLFKGRVALTKPSDASWMGPIFFSAGIGPTARKWDLTLTSDQAFLGADIFSISSASWQAGLVASVGVSSFVCLTCIAGGPLEMGIEARARIFRAGSIDLVSPAFGFTETGATGRTIDYSVLFTAGIPFAIR